VDAIIFVVGLDQYDQIMMEDGEMNRLKDSMDLFSKMCDSPWFRKSNFLLFLNKSDIFKTKIRQTPLTVCFTKYTGNPHDYDECIAYITKRFRGIHDQNQRKYREQGGKTSGKKDAVPTSTTIYPYVTCATDTQGMRFVLDTCQDILCVFFFPACLRMLTPPAQIASRNGQMGLFRVRNGRGKSFVCDTWRRHPTRSSQTDDFQIDPELACWIPHPNTTRPCPRR
jgi:hypothetical protein